MKASQRVHTRSNLLGQHGNLRCLANGNLPKKQCIWLARNSRVTTASWQAYLYLITCPHLPGQSVSAKNKFTYFTEAIQALFFFKKKKRHHKPAPETSMQYAIVVVCTWYLTSASAVLTQLMNFVYYLLSTWIQSRWQRTGAMLPACPDFCLYQTSSFTHSPLPWACGGYT